MSEKDLVSIWAVRPPKRISFKDILPVAGRILKEKAFQGYIDVESWSYDDLLGYWALRYIGASRIPLRPGTYSLEDLGFYEFPDYPKLGVVESPFQALLAGKPTPVVGFRLGNEGPKVYAKLEWYNPFSLSIKDRIAWYMIKDALEEGRLRGSLGILEVSSSNTGIALTSLATIIDTKAKIYLPSKAPTENENILRLLGADVVRSEKPITTEVIEYARSMAAAEGLIHLDQFNNDANIEMHMRYTARELFVQLRSIGVVPTHLVLASGTSGTAAATIFVFSKLAGNIESYIVVPEHGSFIEGIRRLETGVKWLPEMGIEYNVVEVSRRKALEGMVLMARSAGMIPGVSGGAVIAAIRELVEQGVINSNDKVATIIPDSGFKYPAAVSEALEHFGHSR